MSIKRKKSNAVKTLEKLAGGPLTLGRRLESLRLSEDMSQPEFAKLLGVSKSHLNDIEKGRKSVSPERAARFAKILGFSEERFIELALQAIVDQAGLKFRVDVKAS